MEVADHHGVEALGEAGGCDLVPQPVAVEAQLVPRLAREVGNPVREGNAEVGMQQPVERDARGVTDHPLQHAVAEISADQPVAVVEPDPSSLAFDRERVVVGKDADRVAQKGTQPEVVVPVQIGDLDAGLAQSQQHGKGPEVTAGDRIAILEPKVEQIADDEKRFGAAGKGVQKIVKAPGAVRLAGGRRGAEMGVGDEEDRAVGHGRPV